MIIYLRKNNKGNTGCIALVLLFLMSSMKWLIEGIFDKAILEVLIMMAILLLYINYKGMRVIRNQIVWLLYVINVFFSILIHNSTIGIWGKGAVTILTCFFIMMIDIEPKESYKLVKAMIVIGIIAAILVFLQYMFKEQFNDLYVSRLNETAQNTAKLYLRYGYYFGLLYNPHEPAGLISISIIGVLGWSIINKSRQMLSYLGCAVLIAALLLTGKKAVLLCAVLAFLITLLSFTGTKKQWINGIAVIVGTLVLFVIFFIVVINNPDILVFKRFNSLFVGVLNGDAVDSNRMYLFQYAIEEWKTKPFLGIGWRQFNALTVSKFHMSQGHEVNNDYLQWLCETGIIGFVLMVTPVVVMLHRTVFVSRKLLRNIVDSDTRWAALLACFIQFFTVIYAFVEIPFFDLVFFTIYAISCVVINSMYSRKSVLNE